MRKRLLSMLLCMCMMMSLLPVSALAADDVGRPSAADWFNSNKRQPEQEQSQSNEQEEEENTSEPTPAMYSEMTQAAPTLQSGKPTEGQFFSFAPDKSDVISFRLNNEGTLIISGNGPIQKEGKALEYWDTSNGYDAPMSGSGSPFAGNENIKAAVIENGVTDIPEGLFQDCVNLTSVTIANSVTYIGDHAFENCYRLGNIKIPGNVTSIGAYAFANCSTSNLAVSNGDGTSSYTGPASERMTSIVIPDSVTSIGEHVFDGCDELENVTLSKNLTSIADYMFKGCSSLSQIAIPNGVTRIGSYAFSGCPISYCVIPNKVTTIGDHAFSGCLFRTIMIPDGVTSIGSGAFARCENLASIEIPNSVTAIGAEAFMECGKLTSATISNKVETIESHTFSGCGSLTDIFIPASVKGVKYGAFVGCERLSDVYFGGSEIQWKAINFPEAEPEMPNNPTTHWNSMGIGISENMSVPNITIWFFTKWDENNRKAYFNEDVFGYTVTAVTEIEGAESIDQLVGKYVLVETVQRGEVITDSELVSIKLVESKIGTCSSNNEFNITIDGKTYDYYNYLPIIRDDGSKQAGAMPVDHFKNKTCLYHVFNGKLLNIEMLKTDTAKLSDWDSKTKQATLSGNIHTSATFNNQIFHTNFLSDIENIEKMVGKYVTIRTIDIPYIRYPVLFSIKTTEIIDHKANIAGEDSLLIGETKKLTGFADINQVQSNSTVTWTCENSDIVSFVENGKLVNQITHPINNISNGRAEDSIQIKGIAQGQAVITCLFPGTNAGIHKISVYTKSENKLQKACSQWLASYDQYVESIKKALEKATSVESKPINLNKLASGLEKDLEDKYGIQISGLTDEKQKLYICKALLKMLNEATDQTLNMDDISTSDIELVPSKIVNEVIKGIKAERYTYDEERPVKVEIVCSNNFGARFGTITYSDSKTAVTAVLSSTQSAVEEILNDYILELYELGKNSLIQAYKETYKALNKELFGRSASCLTEDFLGRQIQKFDDYLHRIGLGDVPEMLNSSYNYYKIVKDIQEGNYTKADKILNGTKKFDFDDPSASDNLAKLAVKGMKKSSDKISKLLKGEAIEEDNWFLDGSMSSLISIFKCPVNIFVYNTTGQQVGYVGEDDIWYNGKNLLIEKYGETKIVYSRDEPVRFEIVATEDGSLSCTFEEYSGEAAIGRINYYNIPLSHGTCISAEISGANLDQDTIDLTEDGKSITADENINLADYENATVSINCSASIAQGAQLIGAGKYIRGDAVKLIAMPEDGYICSGWESDSGQSLSSSSVYEFTAKDNISVKAVIVPDVEANGNLEKSVEYFVTFVPNGGDMSISTIKVGNSGRLSNLPTVTRRGYIFCGWYTNVNDGEEVTTDTIFTSDSRVYAHWIIDKQNIGKGSNSDITDRSTRRINSNIEQNSSKEDEKESKMMPNIADWQNPFLDIDERAWYYPAVQYVSESSLMTGAENNYTFAPKANLSRAMLAQILYNKEENPEVAKGSGFGDVASGAWYENAITWAAEKGIVSGYEDGRFAPNDPVTREQFAVMLWRYSGSPSASTENLTFNDTTSVRSYALEAMAWAVSNNIISGYEGNWLAPGEYASRVQVAQMLKNYLDK